jgi:putative membrane protein insertion efficiency factor
MCDQTQESGRARQPHAPDSPPSPRSALQRVAAIPFILLVRGYQITLGPLLGGRCRFYPTCSEYALDALREQPIRRAIALTLWRLLRCHPFAKGGVDTVPLRSTRPDTPSR